MKLEDLKTYREPPPEKKACTACDSFAAECLVPVDDLAMPMCWLCAHHIVEHEVALAGAVTAECDCAPREIYPAAVFAARRQAVVNIEFAEAAGRRVFENLQRRLSPHIARIVDSSGSGVDALPRKQREHTDVMTHCRHGHEYTEASLRVRAGGKRECRICDAANARSKRAKS